MTETISFGDRVYAIIIRAGHEGMGIDFFTPPEYSQQLAYMRHPTGKFIEPHIHNHVVREVSLTQEVLVLRRGKLRVDFYDDDHAYLESHILRAGDIILLASGGHGFEVLEEIEMVEVKQGPYAGEEDKTRFGRVPPERLKISD